MPRGHLIFLTSCRTNLQEQAIQVAIGGPRTQPVGFPNPGVYLGCCSHHRALRHNPEGEIQRKSPAPFECVFSFPFPLLLPPLPTFLSNPSLFMIAWITEEEIRRQLKERCNTKLMNK